MRTGECAWGFGGNKENEKTRRRRRPNDIQIYYYLKGLKVPLGGLYNRVGFAQQYDVAFGEHGTLRRRLDDGLLIRLDDGVHLWVRQTTVGIKPFSLDKTRGDGRCRDATYRRYNDGTAGTLRDERFDRTAGGGPILFYHAVHNATDPSLRPAHVQQQ